MTSSTEALQCVDCGESFPFTTGERQFYAERGFTLPKRCKSCRDVARAARGGGGAPRSAGGGDRPMFETTCHQCGAATQVPFRPTGVKPVLCRDCFRR